MIVPSLDPARPVSDIGVSNRRFSIDHGEDQ